MPFELLSALDCLISNRPEKYLDERAISLFQFQTWIYFPDDEDMVDAAGKLAAAAMLRKFERKNTNVITGMGRGKNVSSEVLIKFLKETEYGPLYNAFFGEDGFTKLLKPYSPDQFNRNVYERCKAAKTVSEMIDFRFRVRDHENIDAKHSNISRSEFYRWYKHPGGPLSWRTIRSRWKDNRRSAPFLYVNEKLFGSIFSPSLFDLIKTPKALRQGAAKSAEIEKFVGQSLYVAKIIDADILEEYDGFASLQLPFLRPETTAFRKGELAKMDLYEKTRDTMRSS
jgi:hypothetical protein